LSKSYSIAAARNQLPGILHDVEHGRPVEITRRGKPVAVVVSIQEYRRMSSPRTSFAEAYAAWRKGVDPEDLDAEPGYFDALRDRSPGRDVNL
jgi:antitoxin Phd